MKLILLIFIALTIGLVNAETRFSIPLKTKSWKQLNYKNIPSNKIFSSSQGFKISVDNSASPLIYMLPNPEIFRKLSIKVQINGGLVFRDIPQGNKNADDFLFRIGAVYEGVHKLNFFQKLVSADWIKELFESASHALGLDHVHFFNTYTNPLLANQSRTHPASKFIKESFILKNKAGLVEQIILLDNKKRIVALWISCDGDDTKATYDVLIKKIELLR